MAHPRSILEYNGEPVFIAKETQDYRIESHNAENWFIIANREFAAGELIVPSGTDSYIDVMNVDHVEIILRETGDSRKVSSRISAVPRGIDCKRNALELPWCFMNHSCAPNTVSCWHEEAPLDLSRELLRAKTKIAVGAELTFDYALEQFSDDSREMCWCGASNCRQHLGGFIELEPLEQQALFSHASPYVQLKYQSVTERRRA